MYPRPRTPWSRRSRVALSIVAVAIACADASAALAQEPPPEPAPAQAVPAPSDDPLTAGRAALEAGKLEDALALFTRAHRWRPDVDSAAGLAETEDRLGQHRAAAEHFSIALSLLAGKDETRVRSLQARLLEQKKFVATVVPKVPGAPGATVLVDGAAVGQAPLRLPIYLDPGKHVLTAEAQGRAFSGVEIVVAAGQVVTVPVRELEVLAATSPPKPLWPAFVLGSVGASGIGVGIGTLVVSLQRESEAEDRAASIQACDPAALDQRCAELASVVSERNALRNASTVGFIAAGVMAAATIGYLLVPLPSEEDAPAAVRATSLWVAPSATADRWGFVLGGELW